MAQVKNIRKNYTVKASDKILFVHTAVPITITFPKTFPNDLSFVILGSGTESTNNITIAYPDQSDTVVSTDNSITVITHNGDNLFSVNSAGASGGGVGDVGWSLNADSARLNDDIGLNFGLVSSSIDSLNPLSVIDTSSGDVQSSIDALEDQGQIKIYKAQGINNIILDSLSGFSDGTNTITVVDSAILFFDGTIWQVLYNNEWKTKVIDISSAEILDLTTPIELLPNAGVGKYYDIETTKMKVLFGTTPYDPDSMTKIEVKQGLQTFHFNSYIIAQSSNTFGIGARNGYTATNQNVTLSADAIALDGDGTAQAVLIYKVNTF